AAGRYAEALAGYLCWLASRYEEIRAGLRSKVTELRQLAAQSAAHRRTPEIVANLAAGLSHFLAFAVEAEAIAEDERAALWARCWEALGETAAAQSQHLAASEPTRRFLDLLTG